MTTEHIMDALNLLDDDLIREANGRRTPKARRNPAVKWAALAACLCLVFMGAIARFHSGVPAGSDEEDLPLLAVPDLTAAGMGFEGLLYYDITQEGDRSNPWSPDLEVEALPVFHNPSCNSAGLPYGLTQEAMLEKLDFAAEALGVERTEVSYEKAERYAGDMEDALIRVSMEAEGISIAVDGYGTTHIFFNDGLPLPEEYSFANEGISGEEAAQALDYLMEQYARLLGFTQPQRALSGEYNIYGAFQYSYRVYDGGGSQGEDILNYNFRCAQFYPDESGRLWVIRLFDGLSCGEKLGDYPIISPDEALDLLLQGYYATSVPCPVPGGEAVAKVELVYRNSITEETLMPYYRFYVEVEEAGVALDNDTGLKTYGAYYVPAVEPRYLSNMTAYDGAFN